MIYKEKKRSMFFGLPWSFTTYTITDEIITTDSGLLRKDENDCYLYKVIDVRLENTLLERIFRLGTIHCFTGDGNLIFFRHMIQNSLPCRDIIWAYIHREGENAQLAVKQMISNYLAVVTRRKKRYQFEMTEHEAQECLKLLKILNPEMTTGFPRGPFPRSFQKYFHKASAAW